ncbi:TRAP transporter small permease [Pseudodonghicola flavimaris]|uniref:TRAP transporter small permease protein n=1 Tax=Pseudodonghicola flavimaris TaxID=3050036 RepID=A0ABT7F7U5_9RHOB|nr:TRAP transporter small permease [Pseudodonghicola flavimaris]MDK3020683.1 TRAP transporter small permease [Pseudodonghicola flavimaris]
MDIQTAHGTAGHIRGLSPLAWFLTYIACLLLFAMMFLTFADVMGRYLFSAPLPATYEVVSLMMPAIIFCALPLTVLNENHVTVDLLDDIIPLPMAKIQAVFVHLFCTGALGLIAWRLAIKSFDQHEYEEVTDELFLAMWPFSAAMAGLCAIATLAALGNVILVVTGRKIPGKS